MNTIELLIFSLVLLAGVLLISYILNPPKFKKIQISKLAMYISGTAMIGVFGEIFLDTLYNLVFNQPLWRYHILPVHDGYTSYYALYLWGLLGLYQYLVHEIPKKWTNAKKQRALLIFSLEALVLESIVNLISLGLFDQYTYYYLPGDLWHITTIQNIPFYYLCGRLIIHAMRNFSVDPIFYIKFCSWAAAILIFMAI